MVKRQRVDLATVTQVLMSSERVGAFERVLGFRAATGKIKPVHIMNDLAQCVLGGAPDHGGDFLCRVIREGQDDGANSESAMRADVQFGRAFDRAFPRDLGVRRIRALRNAAGTVLNFDDGIFKAGDRMTSPLATHRDLLGFEGFRRFQVGRYLANCLGDEGCATVRALYESDRDPISLAFRPLALEGALVETQHAREVRMLTDFDKALGEGLRCLLRHRLTKPALLRSLALACCMGITLKVFGAGRPGGRATALALSAVADDERHLREEAAASLGICVTQLDREVARCIPEHPLADKLLGPGVGQALDVADGSLEQVAPEIIAKARAASAKKADGEKAIYWPDAFARQLGQRVGFVLPREARAGWSKYFALESEHVEVLALMHTPVDSRLPWRELWVRVRDGLGLLVGANASADAIALHAVGVPHVSVDRLKENADALLRHACRRGVARRLPDSAAEVGGVVG